MRYSFLPFTLLAEGRGRGTKWAYRAHSPHDVLRDQQITPFWVDDPDEDRERRPPKQIYFSSTFEGANAYAGRGRVVMRFPWPKDARSQGMGPAGDEWVSEIPVPISRIHYWDEMQDRWRLMRTAREEDFDPYDEYVEDQEMIFVGLPGDEYEEAAGPEEPDDWDGDEDYDEYDDPWA